MPGYGQRTASGRAGHQSGSYSGGYGGVPGMPGAPAPAARPYPTAAQPYPTGQPAIGSDMAMLGGAVTIDTRNIRRRQSALWSNPLFWPFAAVAWPFVKLGEAVSAEGDRQFREMAERRITEQTGVPFPNDQYASNPSAQASYERAQQEAIARQLLERQGSYGSGAALATGVAAAPAAPPTLSIAEELAALRAGRTPGAAPDAPAPRAPAAAPPPPSAAPVPGAAAADEVHDRDGDGRPDRWVYRGPGGPRELLDEDGDGRPERTVYYTPDGAHIARITEDTDGDGEPDSWSVYEGGEMVRRRADTNGDGEPDTWTFYEGGEIVRLEADTDGDGLRDRVEHYEGGRLVRRSEDLNGDGRPERITYFDRKGRPTSLEEDRDGDGEIDVRSHYARGKLVRRELLDAAQATP